MILVSLNSFSQKEQLDINLIEYSNDTIAFEVKNMTLDTFYVSIYMEILNYKNDTIRSSRDIFSNPKDFYGTLVMIVLPEEIKNIRTRMKEENISDIIIYSNKKHSKQVKSEKYRLLVKANKSSLDGELYEIYSNWTYKDSVSNCGLHK